MIVSHDYRFIFIHVPRTAGTSIEQTLCSAMGIQDWQQFVREPRTVWAAEKHSVQLPALRNLSIRKGRSAVGSKHITAKELRGILGEELWRSYFKFAFVRNPWDRTVSSYLKKRKESPLWLRRLWPTDARTLRYALRVKYELLRRQPIQQWDYVSEGGDLIVDFVGKFEHLQRDFAYVCQQTGIPGDLQNNGDATTHPAYRDFYDDVTRRLVGRLYATDIERFLYRF